ncbi:MAG: ATP-binding protein [Dokdonella sp.]
MTSQFATTDSAASVAAGPPFETIGERLQTLSSHLAHSEYTQDALFAISDMVGSGGDTASILRRIHLLVGSLMYAENFFVVLRDIERDTFRYLYYADLEETQPPKLDHELPLSALGESLTWHVLREGKPLMGDSLLLRSGTSDGSPTTACAGHDWLGVPMRDGDKTLGAMVVQNYQRSSGYAAKDCAVLGFACAQVLRATQNRLDRGKLEAIARLNAELQQRVDGHAEELRARNVEVEVANAKMKDAQEQAIQSEKLASIGQLAAGVAHEINNPIGYVNSNLGTLQGYVAKLLAAMDAYGAALNSSGDAALIAAAAEIPQRFDIDFLTADLRQLVADSREGVDRVCKIVNDLKDFSRASRGSSWMLADVNAGLESTLNIVSNQLKYKAQIVKTFTDLPLIECLPSELNQVFLNILMNAGQAIADHGLITVSTGQTGDKVWIAIGDDGAGIPADVLPRIFDPFFTTKAIGSGSGLGLSISYGIIAKHHGTIGITSAPGEGTLMRVELPIKQPQ